MLHFVWYNLSHSCVNVGICEYKLYDLEYTSVQKMPNTVSITLPKLYECQRGIYDPVYVKRTRYETLNNHYFDTILISL